MYRHATVTSFLLLLNWIHLCASAKNNDAGPALLAPPIVHGQPAEEVQTFMASLRTITGTHGCGGTLIHPRVVLTAAHCIKDGFKPDVDLARVSRIGRSDLRVESFKTLEVIVHKDYNPKSLDYDIALLVLDKASKFKLLPLESSAACFEEQGGCPVRLLGWGTTEKGYFSSVLLEGFTRSVSRKTCEELIGSSSITKRMICAGDLEGGKSDTCQGDSGGPMLLGGRQVGIVSFGRGCAQAQKPGVYTSVPELYPWIQSKITDVAAKLSECECTKDGISGHVSTGRIGCKAHLESDGDPGSFCMVAGGLSCPYAKASNEFPGAAWMNC